MNYDWVWRHEIMSDIELGWYMQLTKQKLKDAIFNGQIVLGDEFGRGRTETVKFKTGVQTFKVKHSQNKRLTRWSCFRVKLQQRGNFLDLQSSGH